MNSCLRRIPFMRTAPKAISAVILGWLILPTASLAQESRDLRYAVPLTSTVTRSSGFYPPAPGFPMGYACQWMWDPSGNPPTPSYADGQPPLIVTLSGMTDVNAGTIEIEAPSVAGVPLLNIHADMPCARSAAVPGASVKGSLKLVPGFPHRREFAFAFDGSQVPGNVADPGVTGVINCAPDGSTCTAIDVSIRHAPYDRSTYSGWRWTAGMDAFCAPGTVYRNCIPGTLQLEVRDPRALTSGIGPSVAWPYADGCCPIAKGATADGATHLLLRVQSKDSVTFELKSSAAGSLKAMASPGTPLHDSGSGQVSSTPQQDGFAYALYKVPSDIGDPSSSQRTIKLHVTTTSDSLGRDFDFALERPPVLMLHGFWSEKRAWFDLVAQLSSRPGFQGTRFRIPSLPISIERLDAPAVLRPIAGALEELRGYYANRGVVNSRADVVTKSTGGPVARMWAASSTAQHNFYAGDFNRVITIAAIHSGSFWADALMTLQSSLGGPAYARLADAFRARYPIDGTVLDLGTNSPVICSIPEVRGAFHAIVGQPSKFDLFDTPFWGFLRQVYPALSVPLDIAGFALPHDGVTTTASASGGLSGAAVSVVPYWHSSQFASSPDLVIENTGEVAQLVHNLLNAQAESSVFAAAMPAGCVAKSAPALTTSSRVEALGGSGPVVVVTPLPPSAVLGSSLSITASSSAGRLRSVLFLLGDHSELVSSAPFTASFSLDKIGPQIASVIAVDQFGRVGEVHQNVMVSPSSNLQSLAFNSPSIRLALGQSYDLELVASFASGEIVTLPLNWPGLLATSSNTQVANVSPTLQVSTVGVGVTRISATLGGSRAEATISVDLAPNGAMHLPRFTMHPVNQTVRAGERVLAIVETDSIPESIYTWMMSVDGGNSWNYISEGSDYAGINTGTLTIRSATIAMSGFQYRATATNNLGDANSTIMHLAVVP